MRNERGSVTQQSKFKTVKDGNSISLSIEAIRHLEYMQQILQLAVQVADNGDSLPWLQAHMLNVAQLTQQSHLSVQFKEEECGAHESKTLMSGKCKERVLAVHHDPL